MEKKELYSMKKLRGVTLAMGVAALIGLAAPEARAGNLTMVISWGANALTIDAASPLANPDSTANFLDVNTAAVNAQLAATSAITLSGLTARSNNPGQADPTGATLQEQGTATVTGTGITTITIATFQTQFTIPAGAGTLSSSSTANYTNSNVGASTAASSSYNTTLLTPTLTYNYTGATNPQAFSGNNSIAVGAPTSPYTLDNSATISLTAGSNQFSVAARYNAAAVPEPASIILMLTGMPLPLVVMGLLRRRRAAA
jgi:hypothetical protein